MVVMAECKIQIQEKIFTGVSTSIYRGCDDRTQKSVIVKALNSNYPSLQEIARLRYEYGIIQNLDCQGIVKPYGLERYQNGLALILEDFGGQSLKQMLADSSISLTECLRIAIAVTETLGQLHKIPILHKDINPSNIIINPATGEVKITDFSIASRLSVENPSICHLNLLEGTPAYIAPEQTGRMNRGIDYRADFYSLGATLYEMLTGKLPFEASDLSELVHCHLAKSPTPPHQLNKEIPEAISSIVMKLMAKKAEDRYQSASGLKFDLETCLEQLQTTGIINELTLGQRDRGNQLQIPQKLYGRESEVQTLLDAFERVSQGDVELVLISGYSGIGKTSIVNEIHQSIVKVRGSFLAGKFEQLKRNVPYAAFIEAFSTLIRQLLTESSQVLALWKEKLLNALEGNGQIIIDLIPEVELIIGEQPKVAMLQPSESQNRFNRVLQRFIGVFTQPEHPLVLFLDDLQWADLASLQLLQTLITGDRQHLLVIGAYRNNEVSSTHPLMETVERLEKAGTTINQIAIKPLQQTHVEQLVAETLDRTSEAREIIDFAALLFQKTQGNPFFITQLLKTFYSEKLLAYDIRTDKWQWDIEQIQAVGITDYHVVELVARNIVKLPETTQQVLKLAACLGDRFSLEMLAIINEESITVTAKQLWEAIKAGLVLPISNTYKIPLVCEQEELAAISAFKVNCKFLHDRVQQAAYSLISEFEKKITHLKIGQLLLTNLSLEEKKENIFALVNQLNFSIDLITSQLQKDELAELNLIAGQQAKAATAYEAAVNYLNVGLKLLSNDSWNVNYDLTLKIYVEALEAEYLTSNFERSNTLAEIAIKQVKTLLEQVKIYESQIYAYIAQNKMQTAIELGLNVLEKLNLKLEKEPPQIVAIEELACLPPMSEPYKLSAFKILMALADPAYVTRPDLLQSLIFTQIALCLQYGNPPQASYAYVYYGLLLCSSLSDIEAGYRFGQLALNLLEKFNNQALKAKILNEFYGFIKHWKKPLGETLEPLLKTFNIGLEIGDLLFAGYAVLIYCTNLFFLGEYLVNVEEKQKQYISLLEKLNLEYHACYGNISRQLTLNLLGKSENNSHLIGEAFNELEMLPILQETNNQTSLFYLYLCKVILLYLFKQPDLAIVKAKEAQKYEQAVSGLLTVAQYYFYYSLALLARYPHANREEQSELLKQVEFNQEKMKNWAHHAPTNFKNKYELVEAEKARFLGQNWEAIELYDRAITGAKEQGFIHEEAIGNELAAEFYLSVGKEKIARTYLTDAYYGYAHWGALAKVKDLETRYPQWLSQITSQQITGSEIHRANNSTITLNIEALDLCSIIKASQAISQEIVLDKLLDKLMRILLENLGAQTGFLILSKEGKLVIEVAASIARGGVTVRQSMPVEMSQKVPISAINYVTRTRKTVVLKDAVNDSLFASDPYIQQKRPKSLLGSPIINQGKLIGMVYFENNLTTEAFSSDRVEILNLLSPQIAISLENAYLYRNLQQSQARERAAQQMRKVLEKEKELNELKSRFISMTSHEFRTPLATIMGYVELFKYYSNNWSEEKKQDYLARIASTIRHMTGLLDDVLLLSKAQAQKLEFMPSAIDLEEFCRSLVEEIQTGIKTQQTVTFSSPGNSTEVQMDEKLLRHILGNLLSNAVKYSPANSNVCFSLTYQEGQAIFQIQDSGIGIPIEDQQHLFEPFHRAKNTGKIAGTGLGLAIVKKSVQRHGGQITVESEIGVGTTFTVAIPLVQKQEI
ncbi:MAG: trifunctional serine/threonine-protein kinase/ATP-binding protein/sensor histidine kinase [Hydrococcus sp. Prado102]|jgi:predicted ATPase/signal transduction histidine kinase/tRNA A-37 threonylcarbamoyl transferase component Bud32|nr:trifunctional serine/threonine-protein kinase/ATP-binding protein/sensor histidine kinase [Hydrococcus sp. Prado102]